jgi:hypothetical protein
VILTQWSIQGKLVTLPNFLQDYEWSVAHLKQCRCYPVEHVHAGFMALEKALEASDEQLDTPRMVALVEHYAKQVVVPTSDIESTAAAPLEQAPDKNENQADTKTPEGTEQQAMEALESGRKELKRAFTKGTDMAGDVLLLANDTEKVYWPWRLLFNPRLQDERAQDFRNWTLGYLISIILAIVLGIYVFSCCLITCLEIEKVLVPGTLIWGYTHRFSLRPDMHSDGTKSLKQLAAHAAISFMDRHSRALFYNRAAAVSHFQLGAAA